MLDLDDCGRELSERLGGPVRVEADRVARQRRTDYVPICQRCSRSLVDRDGALVVSDIFMEDVVEPAEAALFALERLARAHLCPCNWGDL